MKSCAFFPRTTTRRAARAAGIAAALSFLLAAAPTLAAQPTLADIYAVWRAREAAIASFDVHWTSLETIPKHSQDGKMADGTAVALPDKDAAPILKKWLVKEGAKYRYETNGPLFSGLWNEIVETKRVFLSNGVKTKTLFGHDDDDGGEPRSTGTIGYRNVDLKIVNLRPITLTFLPLNPSIDLFAGHENEWRVEPKEETAGGYPCVVLRRDDGPFGWVVLVDVENQCVVRQLRTSVKGDTRLLLDVQYALDPSSGQPLPKSWSLTWRKPNGALVESERAQEVVVRLNGVIAADVFDLEFPPGTLVTEEGKKRFIVLDSGEWREVTREDLLRANDSRRALMGRKASTGVSLLAFVLYGIGAVCLVVAVLACFRRR